MLIFSYGKKDMLLRLLILGIMALVIAVILGHFIRPSVWIGNLIAIVATMLVSVFYYRDQTLKQLLLELLVVAITAQFGWVTLLIDKPL